MTRFATAAAALALLALPAAAQAQTGKRGTGRRPVPPPAVIYVPSVAPAPVPMPMPIVPAVNTLPATPAKLALGREIAELLNGGEVMRIQFDKLFGETMPKSLGENPTFQRLEKQYPGIIAHLVASARPLIEKAMVERAPVLYDKLAQIYATNMTEPELHEMLDFYHSPAGVWLVQQIAHGMDMSALFNRAMTDPHARIEPNDFTSAQRAVMMSAFPEMPAEYRAVLLDLGKRPVVVKLLTVNPLLLAAAAEWGNDLPPELEKQIGQAMIESVQQYIAAQSAAPAKAPPAKAPK